MDLEYCHGQKRYDFNIDEGFFHPYCDPKHYDVPDVSFKVFQKVFVKALFVEDQRSLTAIEKFQMLIPGTRKNPRDAARDID